MESSINFASQRISFVNKISILQKALSNDETPTPSYLYKEINDISYESVGYCESLVEFLVDRLRHQSYHVKLKVLKVMKHVLENGSKEFQLGLRQHVSFVKECTKFSGPPHPVHGNTPYVMVRNIAVDLSELLYNIDPLSLKGAGRSSEDAQSPPSKYVGMGPSRSGGAIQGFGNSPMSQSKGFAGTILHEIEKLGTKLSETSADRQNAVLARLNLSGSSSNYQPPVVSPEASQMFTPPHHDSREQSPPGQESNVDKAVPRHFPGKAGGGWNDDDDDDDDDEDDDDDDNGDAGGGGVRNDEEGQRSLRESHGSDNSTERHESQELHSVERVLIDELMLQDPALSFEKMEYLSNSALDQFLQRSSNLRRVVILDCLCFNLLVDDPLIVVRSLQLLESIVYSQQELVNIDALVARCKSSLVDAFVAAGKGASDWCGEDNPGYHSEKWRSAQTKAAKLILILHQLSSHKNIFPSSQIAVELSRTSSLSTTPVM